MLNALRLLLLLFLVPQVKAGEKKPLFDGKSFAGWEGNRERVWKVVDGALVVDVLAEALPNNEFLATEGRYENFDLTLKVKIEGTAGFINGGVQFRSERKAGSPEMVGYQADFGAGYDGALYDESRRGQLVPPDRELQKRVIKPRDWNEMRIRAEGNRVQVWMNGVLTSDYVERDSSIPRSGKIAVQIHGGGKTRISYRDLMIEELPPEPKATVEEAPAMGKGTALFHGRTLEGWNGEAKELWEVRDGALGFGHDGVAHTRENWLQTVDSYESFDLRYQVRTEGVVGTGVFFRAEVVPGQRIVGWQVDIGRGLDGGLYREGPKRGMISYPPKERLQGLAKREGWNQFRVRAEGGRIRVWLNGQLVNDYLDREPQRRRRGVIALEMSAMGNGSAYFKDLEIERLPEPEEVERSHWQAEGPMQRLADEIHRAPDIAFRDRTFELLKGDTVVFTGPQQMVDEQRMGNLEALLAVRWKEQAPMFRHLSWEGDTVYRQYRMMEWGTWQENLDAAQAGVVVAWFGQLEALDDTRGEVDFEKAYANLLDSFAMRTRRLVVVGPALFEAPEHQGMVDNTGRNGKVRRFSEIAKKLAESRGLVFVDLVERLSRRPAGERLTRDGIHFTEKGWGEVARMLASQLGVEVHAVVEPRVREAVVAKNELWFNLWRCTNWAFAYGDRTTTAFAGGAGRWPKFKEELGAYRDRVAHADRVVHALAAGIEPPAALPEAPPRHDPAAPTAEEEKSKLMVRKGYEVNLFADETLGVVKPIQMRWDERGRLWVACAPTYPQLQPGEKGHDFILILEDTDGDGKADRVQRFAEALTMPMGLEFAPMEQGGGIYLCEGTALYHLPDADHDDRADRKEVILSGFGTGDTHQDANSLRWGADGRLWFSQGFHIWSFVETPSGVVELNRSGLWRFDPRTRKLDSFLNESSAGWNCWGVAFDEEGQVFHGSGADTQIWHTTPALIPTLHPLSLPTMLGVTRLKSLSPEFLSGSHLPDELRGALVKSTYYGNEVSLFRLQDQGSTFRSENLGPLITSNGREFRPLVTMMGPDGAIYVCDWTNPVIGHYQASYRDPNRDVSHGRIWRVTAQGRGLVKKPNLAGLTAAELVVRLGSAERWEREAAKVLLYRMPGDVVIAACDDALSRANEAMLYEMSGVYSAHGKPRPGLVARLARSDDFRRRAWSARLIGLWQEQLPDRLSLLSQLVMDAHPRVRMEAVVACSWMKGNDAVGAMKHATRVMEAPMDKGIDYALTQTIHALAPVWRAALASGRLDLGGRTKVLVRLMETAGDASVLPVVLQALAREEDPLLQEKLLGMVLSFGSQREVEELVVSARLSPKFLERLAVEVPKRDGVLKPGLIAKRLLESADDARRMAGCRLLAAAGQAGEQSAALSAILEAREAGLNLKTEALKALARVDREGALKALEPWWSSPDPELSRIALEVAVPLDPKGVAKQGAGRLIPCKTPDEVGGVLRPFLGVRGGAAALASALGEVGLSPEVAKLALQWLSQVGRDDPALVEVLRRAAGLQASRPVYSEALVQKLIQQARNRGEVERGKAVFHLPQSACVSCHKVGSDGVSDLGPNLGGIGRAMSPESIVEAVIWPKRQVKEGYLLTSIVTQGGKQVQGYVSKESNSEVAIKDVSSGKVQEIPKREIQSRDDVGTMMPEGVVDGLDEAQQLDLLRYLFDLRG